MNNNTNNRPRLGNIINRVFESAGPDGKVRGTPQQIIEKYQALARDAQLSGDRVAAESFLQHSEHYSRMLNEATQAQNEQRQTFERDEGPRDDSRREDTGGEAPREMSRDQGQAPMPREHQPREHQPREHQPREHQPRDQQPREHQPRDQQAREHQPRDNQPREHQGRDSTPRDRDSGREYPAQRSDSASRPKPSPLPVIDSSFEAIDPRDEVDDDLVYTPERTAAVAPPMLPDLETAAPKANGHAETALPPEVPKPAPKPQAPKPQAPEPQAPEQQASEAPTADEAAVPKPPAKRGRPRRKAVPDPEATLPTETT